MNNAHWLLRASLASVFLFHGLGKFPMAAGMAAGMGMPVAAVYMLAIAETLAGILILVGGLGKDWATKIAAGIITVVMLGAIKMVHWGQWSFMATATHRMGGMEFQVAMIAVALYLALMNNTMKSK